MNYDPECRKATRRKINVVLPCIWYILTGRTGYTNAVLAGPVGKSSRPPPAGHIGTGWRRLRGSCNNYFNSELH